MERHKINARWAHSLCLPLPDATGHVSTSCRFESRIACDYDRRRSGGRHDEIAEAVCTVGKRLVVEFPGDDVHVAHLDEHVRYVV